MTSAMSSATPVEPPADTESETTGLHGIRSWRAIYALVAVIFVLYVVLLTALTRWFQ